MNKTELVKELSGKAKVSQKSTSEVVTALVDVIENVVASGQRITLVGFGTFVVRNRKARNGRNPLTGEKIKIAASKSPKFKPGKAFKDQVNASAKKSKKK